MATIPEALALAVEHHRAGRLQEAEQLYRRILAVDPNNANAIHLLGLVALQVGQSAVAIEYITKAVSLKGDEPVFYNSLAEAYRAAGRIDQAIPCFRRAVELKPDNAEGH